jgi:carboxymethylenebutenolidase
MSWTSIPVGDGDAMDLWVERPAGKRAPVVLVLQEICGVNAHLRDVARRVAGIGYLAVAPDLFHRTAKRFEGAYEDLVVSVAHAKQMTPEGLVDDLRAIHAWLVRDAQADERYVAAWGFCMGGRVALRANIVLPLRAVASFYGGVSDVLLAESPKHHGPLLLAWAGRDPHASAAMRRSLVESLAAANKAYVDVEFSDAEHGFFCDERASYHAASARIAWAMIQTFFEDRLRPPEATGTTSASHTVGSRAG